jgi:hypothetical protein
VTITWHCGARIVGPTDDLPHQTHVVPHQEWNALSDASLAWVKSRITSASPRTLPAASVSRIIAPLTHWGVPSLRTCQRSAPARRFADETPRPAAVLSHFARFRRTLHLVADRAAPMGEGKVEHVANARRMPWSGRWA